MSRRAAALLVAACAAVILAAFWLWRAPGGPETAAPETAEPLDAAPAAAPALPPESWTARLSRPAAGGGLAIETVELASAPEPPARARAALEALLAAPAGGELGAVFPERVAVRKVLLGADGTLYVDLEPEAGGDPPPAGSTAELQRVYALVHTALDAAPEAARVVLLWNGVQRRSFSGHVDTARPLGRFAALEAG